MNIQLRDEAMKDRTYEDRKLWENIFTSDEYYQKERMTTEGNDGANEFDTKMLNTVTGRVVLDVGCGDGRFTIKMAERATNVIGVDFSEQAISKAHTNLVKSERTNINFRLADARELPFTDESFDVVVSRRGPVTDSVCTLSEAYRVLKKGGYLMEITIGEKDKLNLKQIFGRGQLYGVKERVADEKKRMLEKVGFKVIEIKEYFALDIFESIKDLIIRLESTPIIPDFNVHRDRRCLDQIEKTCMSARGIETGRHRVTITASK